METHIETINDASIIIINENQLFGMENEAFQTLVQNSIKQGSKNIFVDLSNVKFISSCGIEGFLHAYKICTNNNVKFNLKNVNPMIMRELSVLKLNEIFHIIN